MFDPDGHELADFDLEDAAEQDLHDLEQKAKIRRRCCNSGDCNKSCKMALVAFGLVSWTILILVVLIIIAIIY